MESAPWSNLAGQSRISPEGEQALERFLGAYFAQKIGASRRTELELCRWIPHEPQGLVYLLLPAKLTRAPSGLSARVGAGSFALGHVQGNPTKVRGSPQEGVLGLRVLTVQRWDAPDGLEVRRESLQPLITGIQQGSYVPG